MTNCFRNRELCEKREMIIIMLGVELLITGGLYKTPVSNSLIN